MLSAFIFSSQQLLRLNRRVDLRIFRHGATGAWLHVLLRYELWGVPRVSGEVRARGPLVETGPQSMARLRAGGTGRWSGPTRRTDGTSGAASSAQLRSRQTRPDGGLGTDHTQHGDGLVSHTQMSEARNVYIMQIQENKCVLH